MSAAPELGDQQSGGSAEAIELLADAESVQFAYFGLDPSKRRLDWQTAWAQRSALPQLIRIRARMRETQPWPELIVTPRILADVSCQFDPLTKQCRGR
jgi:hypothetical protein